MEMPFFIWYFGTVIKIKFMRFFCVYILTLLFSIIKREKIFDF